MKGASQSMSRAASAAHGSLGNLLTPSPPLASGSSVGQSSASVLPPTVTNETTSKNQQSPDINSSSPKVSDSESSLQGLRDSVRYESSSPAAAAEAYGEPHTRMSTSSYILRALDLGDQLDQNGLAISNSNYAGYPRHHYDPDNDEVESEDGEVTSQDGVEFEESEDREAVGESDKRVRNFQTEDENNEEAGEDEEAELGDELGALNQDEDENDEELSSQLALDLSRLGCSEKCRSEIRQGFDTYNQQIERLERKIHELSLENHKLRADVDRMQKKRNNEKKTEPTWHKRLRLYLTNPNHCQALSYVDIYKLCCKEENMSTKTGNVHPNLRFRGPTSKELEVEVSEGRDENAVDQNGFEESRKGPEALFVQDDEPPKDARRAEDNHTEANVFLKNFPFDRLPTKVQANIIKFVFVEEGKLIHCITRLDPFMPPEQPTQTDRHRSGLPHRFHLSGKSCNITYSMKPNNYLALLTVCKRWHYLGIYAFYGLNTFAFSSLGEFGRFCTGIGEARRERIQHVELLWLGNQYLTHRPVKEGKKGGLRWVSKRTWDVSWLCQMPRLKTLIIHVDESGSQYSSRRHEPKAHVDWMASVTAGQPNFRMTRSLRGLQGLHFLHALRGMELIQFYDYGMSHKHGGRHPIRDWSFFMDIENVTAMPKTDDKAEAAKLANLSPVLPGYEASQEEIEAIKGIYHNSQAFDAVYVSPPVPEGDEHGDIEMANAETPVLVQQQHTAVVSPGMSRPNNVSHPTKEKKIAHAKTAMYAEKRNAAHQDDIKSEASSDVTPKAIIHYTRADTELTISTVTEDGIANDYDDEFSLAGSNATNPIDLDSIEAPKMRSRLSRLQQDDRLDRGKREQTDVRSIGNVSSAASERSYGSNGGLFVGSSPAMSLYRPRPESTAMMDTLRKRGYDESDILSAIDLTAENDETCTISTGVPSSSLASSSRPVVSGPFGHFIPSLTEHHAAGERLPRLARLNSATSVDDCPFNKRRRL
ncbi:hypothetical protein CORC01_11247 [Colletotrichum orchidophilum]|uniref:DUF7730 domain-containing protein n=1 Tax=Colletotrichum orchidophilum TaxID=1209926 RepID=A0A1G4AWP3_9PEZI|nr:uncharacterized protein CORC01_11247 [Colletotrichum orchidophilum]OHE93472.1 hypothetical protein CORC01_11247 [Colletotrichum orchidophilum]